VSCYIWYSEERPGRAAVPPSLLLLAVPTVTAHLSTVILFDVALSLRLHFKGLHIYKCSGNSRQKIGGLARIILISTGTQYNKHTHPQTDTTENDTSFTRIFERVVIAGFSVLILKLKLFVAGQRAFWCW